MHIDGFTCFIAFFYEYLSLKHYNAVAEAKAGDIVSISTC